MIRNIGNTNISLCGGGSGGGKYVNETIRLKNEIVAGVCKNEGIEFLLPEGKEIEGFLYTLISERIQTQKKRVGVGRRKETEIWVEEREMGVKERVKEKGIRNTSRVNKSLEK